MAVREPSAAGSFYPAQKEELNKQLDILFENLPEQNKTKCVIAPHAGYVYSGKTAAYSFKALKESKTFVILSPSHTGLGPEISVSNATEWKTPLGNVAVDEILKEKLLAKLGIEADNLAHIGEHSIELQIPFLQKMFKQFKILPITIMEQRFEELEKIGNILAELEGEFSIIASGDFTHHKPVEIATKQDHEVIKKIEELDTKGFHQKVVSENLSICGLSPITILTQYCKKTGFEKGKLLHYDTSATETGDEESVVGYAAIGFY